MTGQFRCAFHVRDYGASVAFYRDALGFPEIESWDRGPDDRGTLFSAAAGVVEVLALPSADRRGAPWDYRPPQGAMLVIEVESVDELYRRLAARKVSFATGLEDQPWGHRSFVLTDPDGVTIYFFSEAPR